MRWRRVCWRIAAARFFERLYPLDEPRHPGLETVERLLLAVHHIAEVLVGALQVAELDFQLFETLIQLRHWGHKRI
jgi:hypothetical protein